MLIESPVRPVTVDGPTVTPLRIQVLGPLRVWRGGAEVDVGQRQQRCLLALLLARAGQPIGMTEIIDLLWGEESPASAVNIVHKYIGGLRRLLEPHLAARGNGAWLLRQGSGYQFTDDPATVDLAGFRRLVAQAGAARRAGDAGHALRLYRFGLERWRGRYAEDLGESIAAATEFAAINRELFDAATEAATLAVQRRDPGRLPSVLGRIAAWDPLNEPLHARLVELLDVAGRRGDALAVYDAVRSRLDDEFGLAPGGELRAARRQILIRETAAEPDPEVHRLPVRPAQLPADLPMFVGREAESALIHDLRRATGSSPVIVGINGVGGVGKSTLAVHLAHALSGEYPDGQIYLDLKGVAAGEALETLLLSLGRPAAGIPDRVEARVGLYRSLTAGQKMIVLLDNAYDTRQVRPLIPNSAGSLVLVTSRMPLTGLAAVEGAGLLAIGRPSLRCAREILVSRLRTRPDLPGTAQLDEIVERCGRLPRALADFAARATAHPGLPFSTILVEQRPNAPYET